MSKLILYYNELSPPSRSISILLLANNISFEWHANESSKDSKYRKIQDLFPVKPVLDDNGFILRESATIARYLCETQDITEHWYPKNKKKRAAIDEYLEWHQLGTQFYTSLLNHYMMVLPLATKRPPEESRVSMISSSISAVCDALEMGWLKGKRYLCGNRISIADILAASELEQTRLSGFDPRVSRPVLSEWLRRVESKTRPFYENLHRNLNRVVQEINMRRKTGGMSSISEMALRDLYIGSRSKHTRVSPNKPNKTESKHTKENTNKPKQSGSKQTKENPNKPY